ncbi:hypothetical protein IU438_21020 [Nocardia cyriacigeorgica]|uniref:HIT domain-containing protein n=1 Tax=Nocardia cyriacigeorgica (strain GUH-2) TaxID=1127134 RepID=H6R8V4_NOCCG|nr:hypothetical protein [Nocardia cyriacigeorgica]MBF6083124.1 hypothetical protein [Nocardia cyriacigeorgica]MBF6090528.1 hypothetical protein [Nocardia cyriacigeorgica]MBF6093731.1 hypothetical protein [Nocardia cyriacigeorgica]MBF6098066.1 hypothetical protein [Nocardia cyriacigeorgica]MBF6157879.1 hypothetical protein [Nocardia cyriacigeorgica]
MDDRRAICISCAEIERRPDSHLLWDLLGRDIGESYLLYESENFIVVPGAGALVPGYTLIIPREHILSLGYLPDHLDTEFDTLLTGVKTWLTAEFGAEAHVFEHGAKNFREKGGACADHAHTQVAPIGTTDIYLTALQRDFTTTETSTYLDAARDTVARGDGHPYLFTHSDTHGGAIAIATGAKSQYFRRLLAAQISKPDEWDGVLFPFLDNMRATIDAALTLPKYLEPGTEGGSRKRR